LQIVGSGGNDGDGDVGGVGRVEDDGGDEMIVVVMMMMMMMVMMAVMSMMIMIMMREGEVLDFRWVCL
jgi:hypothetical protein